jgi:uncharacterized protein YjiS (DUF1127 family)
MWWQLYWHPAAPIRYAAPHHDGNVLHPKSREIPAHPKDCANEPIRRARLSLEGRQQIMREVSVWPSRLQASMVRLGAAWLARRKRAREIQELQAFSDRELWDLGLGRSDVRAIADGTYRRDWKIGWRGCRLNTATWRARTS